MRLQVLGPQADLVCARELDGGPQPVSHSPRRAGRDAGAAASPLRLFSFSQAFSSWRRNGSAPMPGETEHGLDGWSIGELRQQARPPRPHGLLLDDGRYVDTHINFVSNGTGYEIVEA